MLSLIILISLPVNIFASVAGGKISGRVMDAETNTPMPGVNIVVIDLNSGAASDLNGDYFILNVPPGVYSLRASMVGYNSVTIQNVEISMNHTTEVDFEMSSTVLELDQDIIVTAQRPPVKKDETSTRHFVDAREIVNRPAQQLTQILGTLPGIDSDAQGELTVRRGSMDQVAFLIDGVRARNPLDFEAYTNVNLSSIQELEIITGAFNAEYGEARSGVFNIVTKEGGKKFNLYSEIRYTPPGTRHWGTPFYDYSTDRYWENSTARHEQWWIDNPNMWVDPNGTAGNDPNTIWTPEEAYQDYMNTHSALNDYTNKSDYQVELSLGGPTPIENLSYFVSGKFRQAAPVTGNSFRAQGEWLDGTAKITYNFDTGYKLVLSGFYGSAATNAGMEYMNFGWVNAHGLENKYAYYDFEGYPENKIDGETLEFTHVLNPNSFYELRLSRVHRERSQWTYPGDENGWEEGVPVYDRIRAVDEFGNPIPEGYNNLVGLHTTGYFYRGEDSNTDWTFSGDYTNQINKSFQIQAGGDFTYYILDRFQEAKAFQAVEQEVYHPYEANIYAQAKLEFEGLIINAGLRYDLYNPNDQKYLNIFDPFDVYTAAQEGREPEPETEPTSTFGQLSPRLGISHPISDNTVLHFSYGHFFQRATYGNYGEGTGGSAEGLAVTGILNTYIANPESEYPAPYNLGNRELAPRKTISYELGIEHNIGGIVTDVTMYYKDYTNTVRPITVFTYSGGRYLTTGNGDYGDSKGVEISIRKPLTDFWGGYLNYSWSTGINGRSGDPEVIAPPGSSVQIGEVQNVGDFIVYDPSRLKFGFTFLVPEDNTFLGGIFSRFLFALDYQIYYAHDMISSHVFSEAGEQYLRTPDKNIDFRIRKEFTIGSIHPAIFLEVHNLLNETWANIDAVKSSPPEDRVEFINSGFTKFPDKKLNGSPFPDVIIYRNLPRRVILGFAISF